MENDLARRFAEMSDDDLRKYFASAQLDESTRMLLAAELSRRGLLPHATSHDPGTLDETGAFPPSYRQLVRGLSPLNAQILLGRLQVDGVDAHLSGANIVQTNPLWFYALDGVRIFVRRDHLAAAFDVINATRNGDYEVVEAEEVAASGLDSLDDKRVLGWRIVWSVAFVFGGISLAALWWPLYVPFSHAMNHVSSSGLLWRGMGSACIVAYTAFWLLFVECVVRRQRRR